MKPTRKYLEHTADILFQAEAESLPELFVQCALAVEESQFDLNTVEINEEVEIKKENKQIDLLLFDFLDELLFYKDSEMLVLNKFKIDIIEDDNKFTLSCKAFGEKIDQEKHQPEIDVKAITMHEFKVEKHAEGWFAQVLLDI